MPSLLLVFIFIFLITAAVQLFQEEEHLAKAFFAILIIMFFLSKFANRQIIKHHEDRGYLPLIFTTKGCLPNILLFFAFGASIVLIEDHLPDLRLRYKFGLSLISVLILALMANYYLIRKYYGSIRIRTPRSSRQTTYWSAQEYIEAAPIEPTAPPAVAPPQNSVEVSANTFVSTIESPSPLTHPDYTSMVSLLERTSDPLARSIAQNYITCADLYQRIVSEKTELNLLERRNSDDEDTQRLIVQHQQELNRLNDELESTQLRVENPSNEILEKFQHFCEMLSKIPSHLVSGEARVRFSLNYFEIESPIKLPSLSVSGVTYYFFPQYIIVRIDRAINVYSYNDLSIKVRPIKYENDYYEYDNDLRDSNALILRQAWLYENSDGSRDMRRIDNRVIHIILGSEITIHIDHLPDTTFSICNNNVGNAILNSFKEYKKAFVSTFLDGNFSVTDLMSASNNDDNYTQISQGHKIVNTSAIIEIVSALYDYLLILNSDADIIATLNRYKQLNTLKRLRKSAIDNRLAILCATMMIECFEKLGHNNINSPEGRILGLFLTHLLDPNSTSFNIAKAILDSDEATSIIATSYNIFNSYVKFNSDPNKILLLEILKNSNNTSEKSINLARILHQVALTIANIDDNLTPVERNWLNLISQYTQSDKDNNNFSTKVDDNPSV